MTDVNGIFGQVQAGNVYGGGNNFGVGIYELVINEILDRKSAKNPGTNYFIVACTIISSTCPDHSEGQSISWKVNRTKASAGGNILQFLQGLSGCLYDEELSVAQLKSPDGLTLLTECMEGEHNGVVIMAEGYNIQLSDGADWTKVRWYAPTE